MSTGGVPVTVAMAPYHHTQELVSGAIPLAGMLPTFVAPAAAADIRDVPLLDYLTARQQGDRSLTAVPAFPARAFVQSWIHVASDGRPENLPDTRTAAVYARGQLSDLGEPNDAIVVAPRAVLAGSGLRPLYQQPAERERADYARTGVYPILSVIAIRSELLERERWLASNVFRAFEVARRRYFARLQDIRGSRAPIPSVAGHLLAVAEVFGRDLWPNGIEQNRAALETFLRYAVEQQLVAQAPGDIAELFADVEPFVDFTDGH
jgi:4,5-dihydroxyphthalate decarboxylase